MWPRITLSFFFFFLLLLGEVAALDGDGGAGGRRLLQRVFEEILGVTVSFCNH